MNNKISENISDNIAETMFRIFVRNEPSYSPLAFHLWFLRNLIIVVFFTPLIYWACRKTGILFMALVFLAAINTEPPLRSFIIAGFWFSIGAYLAINSIEISFNFSKVAGFICAVAYLLIALFEFLYSPVFPYYSQVLLKLLGITGFWFCFDLFCKKWLTAAILPTVTKYTFFIYLFHEPSLNIVRRMIVVILGTNQIGYLVSYLFSPWIFVFLAMIVGLSFKRMVPVVYDFALGGRGS